MPALCGTSLVPTSTRETGIIFPTYHAHFKDEQTEAQGSSALSVVPQLTSSRPGLVTKVYQTSDTAPLSLYHATGLKVLDKAPGTKALLNKQLLFDKQYHLTTTHQGCASMLVLKIWKLGLREVP